MWKQLSVTSLFFGTILSSVQVEAKDLQIDPPKCSQNYGQAVMINASSATWIRAKGAHPERFISAMADISNCFTMTKDKAAAKFILKAGTLSKEQFDQGASRFSNVEQIDSPRAAPKGKMRYGYLEIRHAQSGQLAGRGFGRNNTAGLDFSNWNLQSPTGMALLTDDARLVTGSIVNAFFEFSLKPNNFDMNGTSASISTTSNLPTAAPNTINPQPSIRPSIQASNPRPSTSSPLSNTNSGQPASWAHNSTMVIDASTAPSLDTSLQAMIKPLPPKKQLQVVRDFFAYTTVSRCLDKEEPAFVEMSEEKCLFLFGSIINKNKAQMYIAERRMDTKTAYTTTSLAGGTWKHGRTRSESFIYFINRYGKYIDGVSVRDLSTRIENYRLRHALTIKDNKSERAMFLRDKVKLWQGNMTHMPRWAKSTAILAQGQKECQMIISATISEITDLEAGNQPPKNGYQNKTQRIHPCEFIQGSERMELLDPELRDLAKNSKNLTKEDQEQLMRRILERGNGQ